MATRGRDNHPVYGTIAQAQERPNRPCAFCRRPSIGQVLAENVGYVDCCESWASHPTFHLGYEVTAGRIPYQGD